MGGETSGEGINCIEEGARGAVGGGGGGWYI
jgi:hypothetical protein